MGERGWRTALKLRAWLTAPVKPPDGVTVAVYEAPAPAVTVCELGVAERVKSGPRLHPK